MCREVLGWGMGTGNCRMRGLLLLECREPRGPCKTSRATLGILDFIPGMCEASAEF